MPFETWKRNWASGYLTARQKKVSLTPEGQVFLRRVEKILREMREAVREMDDFCQLKRGGIKIAVPPMIGAYLFPDIFTHFKNSHPFLDLLVFEEGSLAARAMLEREELDLGIIILPEHSDNLNTIPIVQETIVLCVAPTHRLSRENQVSFKQLKNEEFILLKEDSYHRQVIMEQCQIYQFQPRVIFSSTQIQTIKALVSSGAGISFLMQRVVAQDAPQIISLPLAEPITINIGLAWKKDKYLSKASQAFIEFIHEYTQSPDFHNPWRLLPQSFPPCKMKELS
ncbi:LysR family transcriptional regulator [Acetonema longum DSM 6540]|uniref:LysR family transcriptional regulator n=1 Tax=Acetonema longum DSM 6540 TaxID=1009370 RepID=F7NKI3_9FIRM|nr:LysR family transcriptional regulator [Acetonema longum DSM 6540]